MDVGTLETASIFCLIRYRSCKSNDSQERKRVKNNAELKRLKM
jgi:hypothetical protein